MPCLLYICTQVLLHIFTHLPLRSQLNLRQVNKTLKVCVDNTLSYNVLFFNNTSSMNAARMASLRIRRCTLHCNSIPNFANPLLIREITFTESMCSENVRNVLKLCVNVHRVKFSISSIDEEVLDVNVDYMSICQP